MKKLIPALCMLLVAACLMGTSTYAWFSANTTVTANGMSVKAASDGGLAIASYTGTVDAPAEPSDDKFASAADAVWKKGAAAISPASFTGTEWFTGKATDAGSYEGTGFKAVADSTNYAQETKWQLKSLLDDSSSKVYVSAVTITAAGNSAALNESLRVCIKTADYTVFFAPVRTAAPENFTLQYVSAVATTGTADAEGFYPAADATKSDATLLFGQANYTGAIIFNALTTEAADVSVYVYYEGEDPACNSANATNIDTLSVSISYNAVANS